MEVYRDLLHTLKCPFAKNFTINNRKHIIILINWIEDRVIRELEIEDRKNLREDNSEWDSHFSKYLLLINCPYSWPSDKSDCILFLLSEAISINYEELELCNTNSSSTDNHNSNNESSIADSNNPKPTDDNISGKVEKIARTLNINRNDNESDADLLQRCWHYIKVSVLPKLSENTVERSAQNPAELLLDFSLGFKTNDEVIDRIALVEMMLYLSDLRELQDDVNNIITSVQESTANPRLNSSLGKVGR